MYNVGGTPGTGFPGIIAPTGPTGVAHLGTLDGPHVPPVAVEALDRKSHSWRVCRDLYVLGDEHGPKGAQITTVSG